MASNQNGRSDSFTDINRELEELLQYKLKEIRVAEKRLKWLRSQVVGAGLEFETPFGKRALTYADHTASGRCLHCIEDFITDQVLPAYGNTHTDDSFVGSKMTKMMHEASAYVKRCMGASKQDAIMFCGSGTTAAVKRLQEAMGVAVPSVLRDRLVATLREEEKWVVFVGPYEHHSNLLSWRQSTVEVVEIGVDEDGVLDMESLRAELESPKYANRPKLGSFSACSNVTGILTDTRTLARLLHQHGAFACFDFATCGPYVEIDMRSGEMEGYDAVFLSPHKFIGGPGTPGILLMNKALYRLQGSPPSTCGGGTVGYVNSFNEEDTLYSNDIEEREDAGTPPIIQKFRATLAFWAKEFIGYRLIDLHETVYIEMALRRLLSNPNIQVLGNTRVKRLAVLSFLVFPSSRNRSSDGGKYLHGRFVTKLLNDLFGVQARGGCACAGPYGHHLLGIGKETSLGIRSAIEKGYCGVKPGWTRVSFAYYMSKEEVALILAAIEFIAMYGHRFLPLYSFNWVTGDWTFQNQTEQKAGGGEASKESSQVATIVDKFMSYLKCAQDLALSLPENPHAASVPGDIDPNLFLFRV